MDIKSRVSRIVFALIGLLIIAACGIPAYAQSIATESPTASVPTVSPAAPNVTLADNGKTITIHSGQSFLLKLGEDDDWTVDILDQRILKRMINVMVIRGAQGIYVAGQPGVTILSARGGPVCLENQPPCAASSIEFKITIIVK
ncbi:MAG: hypothetical protein P4L50_13150 [Anaerolineaceae bacterium]|nr:hypothetical protein [Anaerolineaceae bacterium]